MAMTNEQDILLKIQTVVDDAKAANSLKDLKSSIRELQGIALQYGDTYEAASEQALAAAGKLTDQMGDLRAATNAVSGDPIENVGNSINFVSSSLSNLDFSSATTGIKGLATNISNIKLGDLVSGIKSVGSAFLNLGKALLTNPLFLLATAITLIIMNFDKLTKMIGPLGDFFRLIGSFISGITDAIGLTTIALDKMSAQIESSAKITEGSYKSLMTLTEALGNNTETVALQYDLLTEKIKDANKQIEIFYKQHKDKVIEGEDLNKLNDLKIQLQQFEAERRAIGIKAVKDEMEMGRELADLITERDTLEIKSKRKAEIEKAKMDAENALYFKKKKADDLKFEEEQIRKLHLVKYKAGTQEYNDTSALISKIQTERIKLNTEIEVDQLELTKKLKEINLKYEMEDLDQRQSFLDKQSSKYKETVESQYKLGRLTYINYESQKLDDQLKYEEYSKAIQDKRFELQAEYYKGDEKMLAKTTKEKEVYEANYNTKIELLMQESAERIAKHYEDIRKENERISKEHLQVQIDILKKNEDIFTQQAANSESELQRLSMGANAFKDYTNEKIEIQNDFNRDQLAALSLQKKAEIAIAISKGEDLTAIEDKYAEKRKMINATNEEAISAIKIAQIQRVQGFMQSALEAGGIMADIAMNLEKRRLKDGEKISRKVAQNQFRAKQALAVGSVIVDTGAAIMKAVATSPVTGGMPFSGIAAAMGALQLAKILTTKFEYSESGSTSGSVSSSSGGGTDISAPSSAPSATLFSQGFLNTINPNTYIQYNDERQRMAHQRVIVVESDITRVQKRVEVTEQRASLAFGPK